MNKLNLVGQKFNMLLVVENLHSNKAGLLLVRCICDCGKEKIAPASQVKRGNFKSCGCNQFPITTKPYRGHPLYDIWKGIKGRCENKNNSSYKDYGGRGVIVCEEWSRNFISFYGWCMGNGWESGLHVDKDITPARLGIPDRIYSPEMCQIVTHATNSRFTRRIKISNEQIPDILNSKLSQKELSKMYNVHLSTIQRIKTKDWHKILSI